VLTERLPVIKTKYHGSHDLSLFHWLARDIAFVTMIADDDLSTLAYFVSKSISLFLFCGSSAARFGKRKK
jgi:hypothetical protein